jgi:hypothetical protein
MAHVLRLGSMTKPKADTLDNGAGTDVGRTISRPLWTVTFSHSARTSWISRAVLRTVAILDDWLAVGSSSNSRSDGPLAASRDSSSENFFRRGDPRSLAPTGIHGRASRSGYAECQCQDVGHMKWDQSVLGGKFTTRADQPDQFKFLAGIT